MNIMLLRIRPRDQNGIWVNLRSEKNTGYFIFTQADFEVITSQPQEALSHRQILLIPAVTDIQRYFEPEPEL